MAKKKPTKKAASKTALALKKPIKKAASKTTLAKQTKQGEFFKRAAKALFGIRCNQDTKGNLWVGKGTPKAGIPLIDEIQDEDEVEAIREALLTLGGRPGRAFWVHRASCKITYIIGGLQNKKGFIYY